MTSPVYPAFAKDVSVSTPQGTSVPGCETTNECYIPYEVTINVGDTVTWSNDDTAAHTVTGGSAADGPSGHFDSSLFMAGTTFSVKFDGYDPGEYPYFCMVHPWMQGIVTVENVSISEEFQPKGKSKAAGMFSDYWLLVVVGIVIVAGAGGVGFAISRSRKSSSLGTITEKTLVHTEKEKGRECNVCGTIIPEGKKVCPNCGDIYSV